MKDTGISILEDMLEKVFDKFTQVEASFRRYVEGSGIDLSLVKFLVELHKDEDSSLNDNIPKIKSEFFHVYL